MSLRRISLSIALTALALLSACALRPHYKDMVQPVGAPQAAEGQTLMMRLVDPGTGQPIQGAKVIAGTSRARLAATSDTQGRISVPVSQALLEENPLVEVVLPKGVKAYQFQVDSAAEPAAPPAPSPASQPAAAPTEETNSTGSTAPTSPSAPETPPVPPAPSTPNPGT
jgi:cell division septation protein DedD